MKIQDILYLPLAKIALSLVILGIAFTAVAYITGLELFSFLAPISFSGAILIYAIKIIISIFER